jgi:hypothetical protein
MVAKNINHKNNFTQFSKKNYYLHFRNIYFFRTQPTKNKKKFRN